jgi:hypothetical protein
VTRSAAILDAEGHLFNLFPDVNILAMRRRVEGRSNQYSWIGSIPGDPSGWAILTVLNGKLGAVVNHTSGRFLVLPIPGGYHEVLQMAEEDGFMDDDDVRPPVEDRPVVTRRSDTPIQTGVSAVDRRGLIKLFDWHLTEQNNHIPTFERQDDGSVIDIMVVFTRRAAREAGSALDLSLQILLALAEMNFSLQVSNVHFQLSLQPFFAWQLPSFVESGDGLEADLFVLDSHALIEEQRDLFAADLVLVVTASNLVANRSGCGGITLGPYAVIDWNCVTRLQFPHEIGHTIGLRHDWFTLFERDDVTPGEKTNPDNRLDNHGYVHRSPAGAIRTIMAYSSECDDFDCPWRYRWSDTNVIEGGLEFGQRLGTEFPADEVNALNRLRLKVAGNRQSICRFVAHC